MSENQTSGTNPEQTKNNLDLLNDKSKGNNVAETTKIRKHKTLGDYVKVRVIYKQPNKETAEVFCGINNYSVAFKQDIEVEIPKKAADFLKSATYVHHFYDDKEKKHTQEDRKKYLVEFITE